MTSSHDSSLTQAAINPNNHDLWDIKGDVSKKTGLRSYLVDVYDKCWGLKNKGYNTKAQK